MSEMNLTYTIQGFDLHQPELGFRLLQATSFAPPLSPRRVNIEIPGMHGQVPMWNDELSAQKLSLRVRVQDSDPDQLQLKWEHIRGLMWMGSNTGLTVRREIGTQRTSCFAQLESMSEPEFTAAPGFVDVVIVLNIPYGRWESVDSYEESISTWSTTVSLDFVTKSTAPVTGALFRFQGPWNSTGAWNEVKDDTTQTGFRILPGTVVDSTHYVIVDPENYQAWLNTTDSWDAQETDISIGLTPLGNGMLTMVSVPGFQLNNRQSDLSTVRSVNANDTTLVVRGRRTYL